MGIEKLNVSKLFKSNKAEKNENKGKNLPIADEQKDHSAHDSKFKRFSNAAKAYALAATILAGSMTSCVEQDQSVIYDNSELIALLTQMMQQQATDNAVLQGQINRLIELLTSQGADISAIKSLLADALKAAQETNTILRSIKVDTGNIDENVEAIKSALYQLQAMAEKHYSYDEEFLAKLSAIINGQGDIKDKLQEAVDAINEQNNLMISLGQLISSVGDDLADKLTQLIEAYKAGSLTHSQLLAAIHKDLKNSNELNNQQLDMLNKIFEQIKSGQITEAEGMQQIIDLLAGISGQLSEILNQMTNIVDHMDSSDEAIKQFQALFHQFYDDWRSGNITTNAFLAQIMQGIQNLNITDTAILNKIAELQVAVENGSISEEEALAAIRDILQQIKNDTGAILDKLDSFTQGWGAVTKELQNLIDVVKNFNNDYKDGNQATNADLNKIIKGIEGLHTDNVAILTAINNIKVGLQNGTMTIEDALAAITDILQQIKNDTAEINEKVGKISDQIANFDAKFDASVGKFDDYLKGIFNNTTDIKNYLPKMKAEQETANKNLLAVTEREDKIIALLDQIYGKQMSKEEAKELLGDFYNQIAPYLKNIGANQIDVNVIVDAIKANKVDLTKTNALIETLTSVVQNLDLSGLSPAELTEIKNLLADIKKQGDINGQAAQEDRAEIIKLLGSIDGSTKAIENLLKGFGQKLGEYEQKANNFEIKFFQEFGKVVDGMGSVNKLIELAEQRNEAQTQAEKTRLEILAAIEALAASHGDGGMTVEELKEVLKDLNIPDYQEILQEIRDAIGNVVTSSDMQNFFLKTKPDLTKTNALIETLTNVVQNINFAGGSGSADMSRVETLLGQILDTLNGKQSPTQAQIQELLDAVKQLAADMQDTSSGTRANAKGRMSLAQMNEIKEVIRELQKQGKPSDTYFYPGSHIYGDDIYNA